MSAKRLDLPLEILGGTERPVDRREPQVGDFVEFTEWPEYRQPDFIAGDFRRPTRPHRILDLLGQQVERVVVDIAALACSANATDHFLAAERLGDTTALDHGQYGGLYGGEPAATFRARTPAADRLALVGL